MVTVEFSLNGLPDNAVHISGFCGEDGRIVELNALHGQDCIQLWPTCLDVLVGCAIDAPLTWCPWNNLSAQYRPCRTHKGSCKHLVSLVLGGLWPGGGDWIISCRAFPEIWYCVRPALCLYSWILSRQGARRRMSWAFCPVDLNADGSWALCGSTGCCSHFVWRQPSGTPTQPAGCLHLKELWFCVSEWIVPLVYCMGDDGARR
jgi:hypothetical protein